MLYWTAAMLGAGIALALTMPAPPGPTPPRPTLSGRSAPRRSVGALELPLGDRRATDRAVARLEAMVRALDVTPARC